MRSRLHPSLGRTLAAAATAIAVAALTACSSTATPIDRSEPQGGGKLTMALSQDPGSLDPNTTTAYASWQVTQFIYGSLLRVDADGERVGDVAESWEQPDDLTYTFALRKDAAFSDGSIVTSADVKYSFERILNPETASPWAGIFEVISAIDTPDDQTITFHLNSPFAPFLSYLSYSFYTPVIDEDTVKSEGNLNSAAMGTGPFALVSYAPGSEVVLKRNEHYWMGDRPYVDEIDLKVITDDNARLSAVKSGTVQAAQFADARIDELVGNTAGLTIHTPERESWELSLAFNQTEAPFDDVNVRRAISVGMDREALIKLVLAGEGRVGSKIPPASAPYGFDGPAEDLPYSTYDPELAKDLLADAGYADGLTVDLNVASTSALVSQAAAALKDQLAEIGVTANIVQTDLTSHINSYVSTAYSGMSMLDLVWQPDPDADIHDIWKSDSSINLGKFSDPALDALIEAGRTTVDETARAEAYQKAQKLVAENAYMVFPFTMKSYSLVTRDSVVGLQASDSGLLEPDAVNAWVTGAR